MSQKIQITLPDKTYSLLKTLAEQEKIRPVTMATALLRKVLESEKNGSGRIINSKEMRHKSKDAQSSKASHGSKKNTQ